MNGARLRFAVTFERFAPESLAAGDAAERGYVVEAGALRDCVPAVCHGFSNPAWCATPAPDCDVGRVRWLDFADYSEDCATGDRESRALHIPEGITDASARRIVRLFGVAP